MRNIFFLITASFILASCSSEVSGDSNAINNKDSLVQADTSHIFVLPAPLQVATFLVTHAQKAHPEFLSDKSQPVTAYATDYERALNLGVCTADIGYAALYGDRQLALDYLARVEDLVKSLRLEPAAAPYIMRLKANIENPDSMSFLLLSMYNNVQKNLNEGSREKTAFYIVSGCYLENLAITLQHEKLQTNPAFVQLIAQEKLWLDNLAEALTYLEADEEAQDLFNTLYTLQDCSKEISVGMDKNNQPFCTFTPEVYSKLLSKSVALRDKITGKKIA